MLDINNNRKYFDKNMEYIYYIESGKHKKIGKSTSILSRINAYKTSYGKNTRIELYNVVDCNHSENIIKKYIKENNFIDESNSDELLLPNISLKDINSIKKLMKKEANGDPIICNLWECESELKKLKFEAKEYQLDALYELLKYRKNKYVYLSNCQGSGKTYIEYLWCKNMMLSLQKEKSYMVVRNGTIKTICNILKHCGIKDNKIKTDNGVIYIVDEKIKNIENEIVVLDDFNEMKNNFVNNIIKNNQVLFVSALCSPPIQCPEVNTCKSVDRKFVEHNIALPYYCSNCNIEFVSHFITFFKTIMEPYCIKCKNPNLNIIFDKIKPFSAISIDIKSNIYITLKENIIKQGFKIKMLNGNFTKYTEDIVLIVDSNKKDIDGFDKTQFCNHLYIIHDHIDNKKLWGRFLRIGNDETLNIYYFNK